MMNIYKLSTDTDSYQILVPINEEDYDGSNLWVNGQLKLPSWSAPMMRWSERENENERIPDVARINPGFYAFSNHAIGVIGSLLGECGELLKLPVNGEVFYAFNPTITVDCMDDEKSEWNINRRGKHGRLIKPVFIKSKLSKAVIFQLPGRPSSLYVTKEFLRLTEKHSLTGINFTQIDTSY